MKPGVKKRCEMPFNCMIRALLHASWRIAHERPQRAFLRVDVPEAPDFETLWADFATPIRTAEDYINSLRGRRKNVFFLGARAGTGRSSSDPAVDQCDGGNLSACNRAAGPRDGAFRLNAEDGEVQQRGRTSSQFTRCTGSLLTTDRPCSVDLREA